MSENKYRHFLLLYVPCRILNDYIKAEEFVDYAQDRLKEFFELLPSEYGDDSQVLCMHYMIHIPDDVRYFKAPLSEISAFWGENYIGLFKHLVKSPKQPLTQIANRLYELESDDSIKIRKKILCKCKYESSTDLFEYNEQQYFRIKEIQLRGITLSCCSPNNVIQLKSGKIFMINSLLNVNKNCLIEENIDNLFIYGVLENHRKEAFDFPTSSIDVGVLEIISWKQDNIIIKMEDVQRKCMLLHINNRQYAITLLH